MACPGLPGDHEQTLAFRVAAGGFVRLGLPPGALPRRARVSPWRFLWLTAPSTGNRRRLARGILLMLAVIFPVPPADAQTLRGRELLSATFTPVALDPFHVGCRSGSHGPCDDAAILGDVSIRDRGQVMRFERIEHAPRRDLEVAFEPRSGGAANIRLDDRLTLTIGDRSFVLDRESASAPESPTTASTFRWPVSDTLFQASDSLSLTLAFPPPGISVSAMRPVVTEGEDAAFTLTREGDAVEALEVPVAVTDADGVLASPAPSSVTFRAGDATATLRLGTTQDEEGAQADAAVALTLQSGSAWVLGTPSEATVTVRDDDPQEVTVAAASATVTYGEDAEFILTRVGNRSAPLTVAATLTDGTRPSPVAAPVSVTFGAGGATATLRLATQDEEGAQADATVTLMLRDGAAYDPGDPSRATVTVRDDDRQTVTIADARPVPEGGTLAFPVTLTRSFDTQVTVRYTLAGTAAAGADYAGSASGALTFTPGVTEGTIRVVTLDDDLDEPEETVQVRIASVATTGSVEAVSPGSIEATGRIPDNDLPVVTVAADAPAVTEGADAAFTLTRAGDLSVPLEVPVTVTDPGTALAAAAPSNVTFGAGDATVTLRLGTVDDEVDESDATVTLALPGGSAHRPGTPSEAAVTVRDDDGTPEVSIADAGSVTEGGTLEFPVSLSGRFHTQVEVDYTLAGTAVAGEDHGGPASGAVIFAPGETEKVISLVTVDDRADEPEETVEVTLALPDPDPGLATLGAAFRATGRIRDDDLPLVTVAAVADAIVEGEDAEFIVTRAGDLSEELTVTGVFGIVPNVLVETKTATFAAGDATVRLSGRPAPNVGADTEYVLALNRGAGYDLGEPSRATVTVRDDDATPSMSIADADAVTEGGTLAFPVTLSGPFNAQITVAYRLGAGTATAGADYTGAASGTVTFAPGTTGQTLRLVTTDDGADEPEETVEVTLALPDPDPGRVTLGTAAATGRILDNDGPPQVTVAADAATVAEGADAVFTLTRANGDASGTLAVAVVVTDAGAMLAGAAPPASVTFEADSATATLRLGTVDDDVDEPDTPLTLTLQAGAGYDLGDPSAATVTVRDDDLPSVTVAADAATVAEGAAAAFTLTRAGDVSVPLAVPVAVTDAGAVLAEAAPARVTFGVDAATATLRLDTQDDAADEPDTPVTLTLQAAGAGHDLGDPHQATVTVRDDDLPVVTVAADAATVTEGAAAAFTLTRAGDLSVPLTVSVLFGDADSVLVPAAPTRVTFEVDAATATLRPGTDDDDTDEADATVTLTLRAGAGYALGDSTTATVTVEDNDLPVVTVAAVAERIVEGEPLRFTVTRTGDLSAALTVTTLFGLPPDAMGTEADVTIAPGASMGPAGGHTAPDADADITYYLGLKRSAAYRIGEPSLAMVTALDDEARPEVSVAAADAAPEGGTLVFPVTLSRPYSAEVTVAYTLGGTAGAGDYTDAAGGAVTFASGTMEQAIRLATTDDDADEPEETVEVTLTAGNTYRLGTPVAATGRIQDDDLPVVTVAAEAAAVTEGADVVFTLTRAGVLSEALEVPVEVTDADGVLASMAPSSVTFGATAATTTLRLGTQGDSADEPDAMVTLTLAAGAAHDLGTPSAATVTVEDDDLPVVTVAAEAATVTEGADVVFTLTRAGDLSVALEVPVAVTDADGVLTSTAPDRVTFGAAAATATLRLGTRDDTADEPDATVTLALQAGAGHALGDPSQAVVTVRDDERRTVSVDDAPPVTEGETLAFPVRLSNPSATAITVAWVVVGVDGAVPGADYADVRVGFVTFAPGDREETISLATLDDGDIEAEEGVRITLSAPDPRLATLDRAEATGRITDADLPLVTIAAEAERIVEGEPLRFTLTRTGDLSAALTVEILIGRSPDALGPASTVTIGSGVSTLQAGGGPAPEVDADTTFWLGLATSPEYRIGEPSLAMVRVLDHDATPAVSVADADAVAEGGTLAFAVTLSGPYHSEVTVDYTLGGTAVAGTDYEGAASGTVTFAPGTIEQAIRLVTTDDATEGPEETVEVTLTLPDPDPGVATLGTATATGRILDDDATPAVSVADADAVAEGGTLAFAVRLSNPGTEAITVDYTLAGTAAAGTDYQGAATGSVTFAPGTIEQTIRLVTVDDDADEPDEAVEVTLTLPDPDPGVATLGTATASGTITDGDLPVVTVAADTAAVTEGEPAVFTLTRAGVVSEALAVSFTIGDADGVLASTAPTGVTFGAGAATATLRLGTRDDADDEADATLTLTLAGGTGYGRGDPSRAAVTVRDDDHPSVSVADAAPVTEGGTLEFPVRLSARFDAPVTIGYRLGGSAAPGEDYAGIAVGSVTFPPGATEGTIRIVTVDDAAGEAEERVLVTLAPGPRLALGRATATGRITDDDLPVVTVAALSGAVTEGEALTFVLTRTGAVSAALDVSVAVTAAEGVLASTPPSRLTFGPGAATAMLRLGTRADALDRPDAPVTLTVEDGAAWTPGDPSEATVTVRDDDPPVVTVAAASDVVLEGEAAAFTLTRTEGDLSAALTVSVAVTAAEGVLASTPPSTVTFEADAATATLPLGTQDDGVGDVDATVTLTLEVGAGYDREDPIQATVTVAEDDLPVVSIADAAPVEEGGTLEFVVSMAHPNRAAVPVAWRLGGGTAAGDDYTGSASGTVVFAPGETAKVISVATVDDDADEREETVEVAIVVGAPGRPGPATEATGRIRDDDLPVVTFAAARDTIVQGQPVSLAIERAGDLSAELFVGFEVVSGGSFFERPPGDVSDEAHIALWSDTLSLALPYGSTTSAPQDYTITVALLPRSPFSSGDRQYDLGSPSRITITARVDDGIPRVSIADAPAATEGDTLSFPVSLDGPSEQEVEVTYRLRGSAVTGEDYSGDSTIILPTPEVPVPRGTLTFAPGDVFEEIVLETEDDSAAEPEETVEIELVVGQDAGVAYGPSTRATGRIRDDDLPVVTVAAVSERIAEGDEAAFTLTRAGDRSQPLTVEALLTDGTLPSPAAAPVSASFGAGDAAATLRLATRDDAVAEADAAVLLVLADGAVYDLGDPSRAVVTVRDDDRRPDVSIADAAPVAEGGTLAFPVRLSIPGSEAITVGYALAGTASAGADYAGGASGSVTFAPGVTERTIRLATLADGADEPQERVQASIVTVAMAGSVEIVRPGSKTAAGTILDIDLPSVTVAPVAAAVVEGEDAAFTLTRAGDLSAALAVSFAFKDAAGVLTSAAPAGTVFGPGAETVRVTLTTGNDEADEADAALTLTLRPDAGYDRGDPHQATVTVRDDDPGSVAVAPAAAAVTEGADAVFVLTRAGDRSAALEVSFTIADAAGVLAAAAPAGAVFGPGAETALVTLATVDDGADEADAALTLTLQADARYDLGVPHQATVTVRDDDLPVVTIAAVADEVAEGAAAAFTLARAGDSSVPLEVAIQVTSTGSSVLVFPADFMNVRFEPGMARHTLRLDTRDDTAVEADATLTLTLGRRASLVLGDPSSAAVTVRDNDTPPDVSIADAATVTEGGTLVFPVTLTRPFGAEIRIPYSYRSEGGTAVEGRDYTNASDHRSEVVFAPGTTARTIRFATVVDGADEDEETVQVVILPAASIGTVQRDRATGRIQDSVLPVVTVTGVAFVYEGRDVAFTLTRERKLQEPLEVSVSFQESTSVLTEEAPTSVRFGAGESTATLRLGTDDDAVDERDNTVTLQLVAGAAYEVGDPSTAIVIVFDNDLPAVTVAADAAAVTEGEAAAFTLTRAGNLSGSLAVPVVVTDPGAVLIGTPPASVRFGARNATATLRLDTQDDAVVEPDAVVTLTLTDGASYDLGTPSQAAVTVRDDDGLPEVSIADAATVTEGGVLEFPVRLSHRSGTRIVVAADYRFTGAAGGAVTFTVAFAPGDTEETISLATVDDDADDGQETVEVTLAAPDPALAVLGAASRATGRILDDDGLSAVTVAAVADAVTEGADAAFTLARANGDVSAALVVTVTVTDSGAVLTDTPPASVTFGAGEAAAMLRLRTLDDAVDEPDATVTLTLAAGADWELGTPSEATVTVRDDELPVVTVAPAADAVAEGADAVFTVARAGDLSAALVVPVTVTDAGSVLIGRPPASVSFGAGDATATLRLGTQDDAGSGEDDTAVILALDDGAEYDLGTPWEATVTVRDDDAAPEVSIAAAQPAPEGGTLAFPVTLTRPYREAVAVSYRFDDGAADTAAEGADYHDAASVKELTFAPGEMRKVVSLVTVDDGAYEGEETVTVTLAAPSPALVTLGTATAAGRILDDDIPVVTVSADAATVTEGADAAFTLARAGDRSAALVVPVTVTDAGSVLAGTPPASVSFSAGDATAALRLGTDDDEADEPDTAVTLTLADGADHDLGTPSEAVVTVRDDDLPEVSIAAAAAVPEGGTLAFAVRLSSPAAAHFSVAYNLTGTAVAGVDHAGSTTGAVTFAPGVIEQTLRLVTVDDDTDEPEETVVVELIDPSGVPSPQAQLGRPSEATGRILDDDLPVVTVAADAAMVTEGADAAFTLTRAGDASEALTVSVAVTETGAVLTGTAPTDVTFQGRHGHRARHAGDRGRRRRRGGCRGDADGAVRSGLGPGHAVGGHGDGAGRRAPGGDGGGGYGHDHRRRGCGVHPDADAVHGGGAGGVGRGDGDRRGADRYGAGQRALRGRGRHRHAAPGHGRRRCRRARNHGDGGPGRRRRLRARRSLTGRGHGAGRRPSGRDGGRGVGAGRRGGGRCRVPPDADRGGSVGNVDGRSPVQETGAGTVAGGQPLRARRSHPSPGRLSGGERRGRRHVRDDAAARRRIPAGHAVGGHGDGARRRCDAVRVDRRCGGGGGGRHARVSGDAERSLPLRDHGALHSGRHCGGGVRLHGRRRRHRDLRAEDDGADDPAGDGG